MAEAEADASAGVAASVRFEVSHSPQGFFTEVVPRLGYDFNRSRSRYLYLLAANTTLATPQQLSPVRNELHRATVDVKHAFARHLGAGVGYWFDKYTVDDFALGTGTLTRLDMPSALLLGYVWRPYTANTVWARLSYFW